MAPPMSVTARWRLAWDLGSAGILYELVLLDLFILLKRTHTVHY
jgi:hypothetical protein